MTTPTISVVTPSYNQGPYIESTILSVISQQGDFTIDYLIMDGGSTDNSIEIIKKYAALIATGTYAHQCHGVSLRWVSERDEGQTDAINKGLTRSRGEILTYLNSDDMFCAGAFAKVARYFIDHPESDFVYGDGEVIDEGGNVSWNWLSRPYDHSVMLSYHFLWNDFTNYIMQQSTFWRRGVVDRIGLFDAAFHYAMDAEYWIRAGDSGLVLSHLPERLGRFRLIRGTKSLSSPTVFWEDYMEIFRKYRRSRGLTPYLAFFYFNHALQHDLNLPEAFNEDARLFDRWSSLPEYTRRSLGRQANRAKDLCQLIVADELRRRKENRRAAHVFYKALMTSPMIVFHPFGAFYAMKYAVSRFVGGRVDIWQSWFTRWYRATRVDYRYHTK